jgi:hypothetical protein
MAHRYVAIIIDQLTSLLRAARYFEIHSPSHRDRIHASQIVRGTLYLLGQANYLHGVLRDERAFIPSFRPQPYSLRPPRRVDRVRITSGARPTRQDVITDSGATSTRARPVLYTSSEQELLAIDITRLYINI